MIGDKNRLYSFTILCSADNSNVDNLKSLKVFDMLKITDKLIQMEKELK